MKLVITESQAKRLGLIKEGVSDTYSRTVNIVYYYHGAKLKGYEIDSIMNSSVMIKYAIEIEAREWGIKDINLSNIIGPTELELELDYWPDDIEMKSATIPLTIDWSNAKTQPQSGQGIVSVGEEIEITLINDKEGNLLISEILIPTYTL
jgi:hypothetical protein